MGMHVNSALPDPAQIKEELPLAPELKALKAKRDAEIRDVFTGVSNKFLVIVGPCSADNEDAVCEYTSRLGELAREVSDKLLIIPRIYTNKPRTTGEGYKGMLHQPNPEAAPDLSAGIQAIRHMHIRAMAESGLTAADEMLYPENRSYLDDILSYEDKYISGGKGSKVKGSKGGSKGMASLKRKIPAEISEEQREYIRSLAVKAFRCLGCSGVARIDFMMDLDEEKIYLNEINTIPGFTAISMYPRLMRQSGVDGPALIDRLVEDALGR